LSLKNISNDPQYKQKESFLTMQGRGLFMNKGEINLYFIAKLFDPKQTFLVKGTFGKMELNTLNSMLERNESVNLDGTVNSLNFEFTADTMKASGELTFLYQNLKIEINNKNGYLRDKISTWFTNYSTIDSNPRPGQKARTGSINYKRDPERFVFNYGIKSVMTGIKSTLVKE
ncbi:MAG TPA: hypothetical protein VHI78_09450, partial [Bacteroidales bacterium]|nr:hypothetical protein [Bacteroidales bacterium]